VTGVERFALRAPLTSPFAPDLQAHAATLARVTGIARFGRARAGDLSFCDRLPLDGMAYVDANVFVLCTAALAPALSSIIPTATLLIVDQPRRSFIELASMLHHANRLEVTDRIPRPFGVHASATIGHQAVVHPEARIDENVRLGAHCVVHRGVWIKQGACIEDGTVLGCDGINAFASGDGGVLPFPHLAGLVVGAGVRIGANAVIVGGVLTSTEIGDGCIIGNLCNIGHGVVLGTRAWISVGSCVGGHSVLGDRVTVGMASAIRDNVSIGEGAQIGMGSVVVKDVLAQRSVFGNPARPVPPIAAGPVRESPASNG